MKWLLLLSFFIPFFVAAQHDTVYYYGVNGTIDHIKNKDIKKEIDVVSAKRIKIKTYKLKDNSWLFLYSEKIFVINDSVYEIKIKGDEFSGRITRRFETLGSGTFKFTDWLGETIRRTGTTKTKVPLILDGEVTEFYPLGRIKSVSEYRNNELVSNKNWLPDGNKIMDNIFYSADKEPRYKPGLVRLHEHILKTFKDSKLDISSVEGKIVVGFVVLENGTINAFRIVKGITSSFNQTALEAFETLDGDWTPAQINNHDVNYFQVFPINFIYNTYDFDSLEMKGSMLYWTIN